MADWQNSEQNRPLAAESETFIVSLSALQHHAFCPRQCALIHNEQAWAENYLTAQGRVLHERVDGGEPETRKGVRYERSVHLSAERLGLTGIADMVEHHLTTGHLKPVEYKRGKPKPTAIDEIQLCAQALCLEEMTGQSIEEGALWYMQTRHRVPVLFSDGLRQTTLHTIAQVRELLKSGKTPAPKYGKHCKACSLLEICQPKLLERDRSVGYVKGLFGDSINSGVRVMGLDECHKYELLMKNRPHVVLLGAGATMAAIPYGDKNGNKSSVMNNFIEELGMTSIIGSINLNTTSNNLEDIYSELYERDDCQDIREQLDNRIREYFSQLEIPDEPNIYDLILLSLRKKDLVATFNWDPLLLQAYQRAIRITDDLPALAFLHGNVLVGYCPSHKCGGMINNMCRDCNQPFKPSRLLYPIRHKNYADDPFTQDNWKAIKNAFKKAYMVTIFGYSAPVSDEEAISLLKESWGEINERNLEDFEFIDIRCEDELRKSWEGFVHSHHYQVVNDFFDSSLARFPRRTTVELFDRTMNCVWTKPIQGYSFYRDMSWSEVEKVVINLVKEENNLGSTDFLTVKSNS